MLLFLLLTHARKLQMASRNSSNSKGGKGSSQPLKAANDLTPEGTYDEIRSVMTTLQRELTVGLGCRLHISCQRPVTAPTTAVRSTLAQTGVASCLAT